MNKIFKVVWSKTKECYVVVSEVAKNNSGKKKVLASVLAGLAMVGLGATVQAADMNTDTSANTRNQINIWANTTNKENPATPGATTASGSGTANANDVDPSTYGTEIGIAIGAQNKIKPGITTNTGGGSSIAMGIKNEARGNRNIAIGTNSKTYGENSIALGTKVEAGTGHGIAIGSDDNGKATVAYGGTTPNATGSNVGNAFALAIGSGAQADGRANGTSGGIAIGQLVNAKHNNTIAIGVQTTASGSNSTVIGSSAEASGSSSAAYGTQSNAKGTGAAAIGPGATTDGDGATALGRASSAKAESATALGRNATANIAGGVALGYQSVTTTAAGVQGYNPASDRTNKYSTQAGAIGTSTLAAVSVGNGTTATRQLTGLAAGTADTDAVNVAQLKNVNLKYAADTGNSDVLLKDGTLTVKGDNDLISTSVVAAGADKGAVKITAKVGGTIDNTDGKAVKPTTNGIATTDNVADAINKSYWKATAGGNTDGTPTVGNVKPGTQVTYSAGDNLKVKQTINNTTGDQEYKYSLNPVLTGITSIANTATGPKMTFGGNSINITGGSLDMGNNKIINLATGTDDKDAVNVKQLKDTEIHITPGTYTPDSNKKVTLTYENADNKTVTGKTAVIDLSGLATGGTASTEKVKKAANGTNDTNIAEVNPQTGDTFGGAGATYEVSVSRNAVKDAAREAVTVNNGGTTTGGTYTADTNNPISVTAVPDNTNHNTTYAVTFDGNKAAKQIPLTYKATNGTITTADQTVKLDKGLNFTGGDYTTASVGADGKVTFDVNLGTAPTVTDGKPGVPGQAGAAGKDGIATVKTVVDTINNSGWKANAKANGGTLVGNSTATVVKPGDQVNFAAGKNLTVKQDLTGEHTYTYSLNKDVDLTNAGSLTVGDTKVNNDGITIKAPTPAAGTTPTTDVKLTNTGLDNGGNKIVNVAEGTADTDAVNVKQLKDAKTVLADGKNTKKSGTGTAADPYKVNVEGDLTGISSITNGGTNNGKISFGPNKTVTVDGDHSITLNASTGKIGGLQNLTFDPTNFTSGQAATEDQLKSVHDTLKANERHIAPTTVATGSTENKGGTTVGTENIYKYDATTKKVTLTYNDGNGHAVTDTKAVIDFSALNTGGTTASTWTAKTSAENTTAGSEVGKHAGDTSQVIGDQNSVDFQAGKNMTVKQTNDGNGNTTINYALDKNLDVESVHVGKDGKDGKIGIDGKDGVDGLDGTNRVDIHVEKGAKGVDGTDGHDGVNGHNGKDGMTRIVYEDKGGKQEVATLNDGMKYAGDDAQGTDKTKVIAKKLNETLDIIGGATKADLTTDNIGVNNDGNGKLLVQLSKNLKGINTIKNGNTTITLNDTPSTTTPAVTITGGNLSLGDGTTNNKIVNVAPGTDDTDAVNVKQLKDAKTVLADGKNTKKSGTGTAADPYKVNVEGDLTEITSITNKADASGNNAGKITFSPNQTVTVSGDHNISLNGKTGDITGLTNTTIPTTAGSDFATKGRAATEEQLKIVNDKFNNKINLGADGSTETTKLALDNNGGIKFNIKGDGSGASGANQYISTTASGSDIKVDLTDDAKAKLNKSYNVTSNDNSVQVKSTTTNGVTTFDLKVAPAAGTTSTWDIKSSADTANGGATATGHETAAKTIANTNSVEMIAGKNLTVKQTSDTNGAKVEFALSDEITVGKDGTNGVDGKIGVNGKDGASVVINGKDGSIGLTGAPGTPGTPGASATLKVKDGVPGVDGAPGTNLTRIVYTDKNNVEHEVATHDDGMKFAGDDGQANQATNANVIKKHLNNVVDIIGGATKTDLTTNNIGVNNDGNGKLLVQLSKNLNGINTVKNGNTTITLNDAPGGATNTPAVTISGGNLSMGDGTHNNKIVNVAPGTADTDAVNVKQLKDTELHITPGTYTPDTNKKVKLTYTDGNGTVVSGKEAVIDLSGLSTGGATASTWNVKSSANTTDGGAVGATHDATAQNIANGKTVEFQSGKNLVVTQTNDTTNGNATVEFSLSDNITVGKDGANGKDGSVGAKGADGSAVVMNGKDGSIGLNGTNGANGISIKGKDGANGVGIDGKDGVTRIVYTEKVPDPANPGTTKEVTHEVATMDDGLKFTGNNTATENKHKLGSLVKVQGEGVTAADEAAFQSASGNIAVTADGTDTLTIRLNKNLKGLNSIQLGDNTIKSNGDNIEFTTKGGTTKTVATTDQLWTIQANGTDVPATNGKVNVVGKDGITVAKNAAGNLEISGTGLGTMNGFDVTANNGATSKTITDGKKVDFNAGSNLTVKQTSDANGTHIEYALKEAVDLGTNGSLKAGDTTVNKDGVTIANGPSITKTGVDAGDKKITNVADGAVNATSKDAVNGSQLKKYTDAAKTTVEAGDTNVKVETDNSAADGHTNYKVSLEPVVTIGDTHKVKIDGHTGDITGLTNVNLTDPTFATKGRAATEEQLKQVLTEAKNKAIEKVQAGTAAAGDTNIATVAPKAGDTFGAAGATYEVSVSKNAVKDAAKEAVKVTSASPAITVTADTSVAHETTYKVGFDGNQAATQIPLTYKQNGGNTRTVKLSDGLNFIDGTNTKARTAADGKVTFDVMGDLTGITSISNAAGGPKMTFGGNSINVTNGDLNMGDNKITNVKKGTATTDAATVGQLTKVTSNNHSVVINKTTDANGAPVYDLAVTGTPGAPAADPRVDMLGEEIGRVGAQGAALSALKPIQYDPLEPTQIMAGYGNYRGNSAVALGVAHYKNESTLIHGGVSWAGGSSHMMANAGVTWKVGNRDSEAAVADRYRKGPISSAYAMQQEMAAMKAQNAGLKGEVSDLKAENEQMKAQIAAMMAKLGL